MNNPPESNQDESIAWEQYLRKSAVPRTVVDEFLRQPIWNQFDSDLGYTRISSLFPYGLDKSQAVETFQCSGMRRAFMYADQKPRINTYGNSFTECNQVNDGETWQEYLGAHFCEPIGNFGVSGHGVYQAYRTMLRHENTTRGAEYVILYIWADDPKRSIMRTRWAETYRWFDDARYKTRRVFYAPFWAHVEMDLSTGHFVEKENPLSTPDLLYNMCDPEWMVAALQDDVAMRLSSYAGMPWLGKIGTVRDLNRDQVNRLADTLDFNFDWSSRADIRLQAYNLLWVYGQRATNFVLDKAKEFVQSNKKRLLVVLNYTAREDFFREAVIPWGEARRDGVILSHLNGNSFDYFDMNEIHRRQHEKTRDKYWQYMSQYHVGGGVGHYNPQGNHLFAYSIKDKLLTMLDPKPLPYREESADGLDVTGHIPGTLPS